MIMATLTLTFGLGGFILSLMWAVILFKLGSGKKNRTMAFYLLLYAPLIISMIASWMIWWVFIMGWMSVTGMLVHVWVLVLAILLYLAERVIWGITAREVAGRDKLVWFFIVLYIPLFGWILYRATEAR